MEGSKTSTDDARGRLDAPIRAGARLLACGLLIAAAGLAAPAAAEVRRVEAVGIYGIEESARRRVIPRDEAIARATWEAVSRVALELIGESAPTGDVYDDAPDGRAGPGRDDPDAPPAASGSEDAGEAEALQAALGEQMLPYTRSYRILEDRGESPVLFAEDPDVETEYVVVVEVLVDVDRVADALERDGLIARSSAGASEAERVTIEVLGLARYPAVERLVALLRSAMGARRVVTLEFERERQLLGLEGRFGLEEVARRLAQAGDPGLVLEPLAVDPTRGRIRLRARYRPEAIAESGEPADADRF